MALLIYFSSMAQTLPKYNGKVYTYTKKGDVTVQVNDPQKTVLYFRNQASMPTATQVFNEYKRVMSLPTTPPVITPPVVTPPTSNWVTVGTGSGDLKIDPASGKYLKVKKGNYNSVEVYKTLGDVYIDGTEATLNVNGNIQIDGGNYVELFGFQFPNGNSYRALNAWGYVKTLYLHDMYFKNVKDYTIFTDQSRNLVYTGQEGSYFKDWKFERLKFENCNQPFNAGGGLNIDTKQIVGYFKGFKFNNSEFINCDWNIMWAGAMDDYEFAFNKITNQNREDVPNSGPTPNGTHNRLLDIQGYGKVHDNYLNTFQGNFVGIRPYQFDGGSQKVSQIYNNTIFNSWKYSAFEIQAWGFLDEFVAKNANIVQYSAVEIYNNTVGQMNTSKDWEGQILDLYNSHGPLKFYNNLGFNLNRVNGAITDMINYNGTSIPEVNPGNNILGASQLYYGNKYFPTWQEAVKDLTSFESIYPGIGAPKK